MKRIFVISFSATSWGLVFDTTFCGDYGASVSELLPNCLFYWKEITQRWLLRWGYLLQQLPCNRRGWCNKGGSRANIYSYMLTRIDAKALSLAMCAWPGMSCHDYVQKNPHVFWHGLGERCGYISRRVGFALVLRAHFQCREVPLWRNPETDPRKIALRGTFQDTRGNSFPPKADGFDTEVFSEAYWSIRTLDIYRRPS